MVLEIAKIVVMIDGNHTGTATETTQISENEGHHGKIILCVDKSKVPLTMIYDPSSYYSYFPHKHIFDSSNGGLKDNLLISHIKSECTRRARIDLKKTKITVSTEAGEGG